MTHSCVRLGDGLAALDALFDQTGELRAGAIHVRIARVSSRTRIRRDPTGRGRARGRGGRAERSLGEGQADRVLHRIHAADEVVLVREVEKVGDVDTGRPGRERQERRPDVDAVITKESRRRRAASATVCPLSRRTSDLVVQRLERGHHEQASRVVQLGQQVMVREHVLDLHRAVERDVGEARRAARARCASSVAARSGSRGRRR